VCKVRVAQCVYIAQSGSESQTCVISVFGCDVFVRVCAWYVCTGGRSAGACTSTAILCTPTRSLVRRYAVNPDGARFCTVVWTALARGNEPAIQGKCQAQDVFLAHHRP